MKLQTRVPPLALAGVPPSRRTCSPGQTRHTPRCARRQRVVLPAASAALLVVIGHGVSRHRTSVNPMSPDVVTALVTEGPRNPMYVGMAGLLAARAVARGRLIAVVPVVGFVAAIDRLQIPAEEVALRARFSDDDDACVRAVPPVAGRELPPRRPKPCAEGLSRR